MANVVGLQPVQDSSVQVRRKKGRVVTNRTTTPRVGLTPTAAPVDTYTAPPAVSQDQNGIRLANALSQLNPTLQRYAEDQRAKKEKDQMAKLRFYTEQFMQDKETGAVTEAQVKEQFPELVPTVAARIAQASGEIEAKKWVQGQIQGLLENDNLRLNTKSRQEYLNQVRAEANQMIGDNEFYGTGFLTQLDKSLNEFETTWMRETAQYHEQVQAEAFSGEVAEVLQRGGDLEELDAKWKQSSSLNNRERNQLVIDTALAQATASNNGAVLDRVPKRFLNAESKAKIAKAKQQIQTARYTQYIRGKQIEQYRRADQIRAGKSDILRRLSEGEEVNPSSFYQTPELYEYALRLNAQPTLDSTRSVRDASAFRSNVLRAGTTGNFLDAFKNDAQFLSEFRSDDDVSQEALRDHILSRTDMNASEKQQLLTEIPTLLDGVNLLRDTDTTTFFETNLGEDLKMFAQSPFNTTLQLNGINVQSDVKNFYFENLRQEVNAYIEDNGEMPRGKAKLDLLRSAGEAARQRFQTIQQNASNPTALRQPQSTQAPEPQEEAGGSTFTLPNGVVVRQVQ